MRQHNIIRYLIFLTTYITQSVYSCPTLFIDDDFLCMIGPLHEKYSILKSPNITQLMSNRTMPFMKHNNTVDIPTDIMMVITVSTCCAIILITSLFVYRNRLHTRRDLRERGSQHSLSTIHNTIYNPIHRV